MKSNLPLMTFTTVLALGSIILFFVNDKFAHYVKENWPAILITLITVVLSAAIAISILYKQIEQNREAELDVFKRSIGAIMAECGQNQSKLKRLKKELSEGKFIPSYVDDQVVQSILQNPLTYKYTGDEFILALRTYASRIAYTNMRIENMIARHPEGVIRSQESNNITVSTLRSAIEECLYYLYILEYQAQYYVYALDVSFGPKPPNTQEIMDLLKKRKTVSVDELVEMINKLGKLDDQERREIKQGYRKIINK